MLVLALLVGLMTVAAPAWAIDPGCIAQGPGACVSGTVKPAPPALPRYITPNNPPPVGAAEPGWYQYFAYGVIALFVIVGGLILFGWLGSRHRSR